MATSQSSYKIPQPRGYANRTFYIEDTSATSPFYFDIQDFPLVVGGGKHVVRFKGNGLNMRLNSSFDVEFIDADGQRIYTEVLNYIDRFNNYYIAFEIYDVTARGVATAHFVGEALYDQKGTPVPSQYRDTYNVRWTKQFSVQPFERNNAELIFDNPPQVSIDQTIIPARIVTNNSGSGFRFQVVTGSRTQFTIQDTSFRGYDRDFASSTDIIDTRLQSIKVDPFSNPRTTNTVPTQIRKRDTDIQNGFFTTFADRYTTIIQATSSFFTKQFLGALFEFYDQNSTPSYLYPSPPSNVSVSGSATSQLVSYKATVVEVINARQAVLDTPLEVKAFDNSGLGSREIKHKYYQAGLFTGSLTYIPTEFTYTTSSAVSESYVQFTFTDLKPISGEVYRIRTSTKFGDTVGDYKLLNDQVVKPVEYLTDAEYPNGIAHTMHDSDYRMIGHFVTQSILETYWNFYSEIPNEVDLVSGSLGNLIQSDSALLNTSYTQSKVFTTAYDQNYNENQKYTLSAYISLAPYTELEFYMISDPLNLHVITPSIFPKAFLKSPNNERTRYGGDYSRFGKYIGKITNDRPTHKYYGRVLFDFEADSDGLGSPLFRAKIVDEMNITGSAYVSDISIKPYTLNGFTPTIVQYAVPLPTELVLASQVSQSIDFKIEYLDYTGRQSEYTTYVDDVLLNFRVQIASNTCQDDKLFFAYDASYFSIPTQPKSLPRT